MEQEKNKMEQGKSKQQRMRELVELLNRARKAYEQDNTEIMSNYEYDRLYDELEELEDAIALKNISNMPARVKCAVLAWHTLKEALERDQK